MHTRYRLCLLLIAALLPSTISHAQSGEDDSDTCPAIVQEALAVAADACDDIGRNTACYGHGFIGADLRDPDARLRFAAVADVVPVVAIESLNTGGVDPGSGNWGVAILRLQANLPESSPGQAVTFVLMGDSRLQNGVPGDDQAPPMQSFYFQPGVSQPACREAPNTLLVQSPQGLEVTFTINGMDVSLGSTVIFNGVTLPDGTQVLVGTLVEGHFEARTPAFTAALDQPGQTYAITLNAEGEIDETSEPVDLRNYPDLADSVAASCDIVASTQVITPQVCDFELDFELPLPDGVLDLGDVSPAGPCVAGAAAPVNIYNGPGYAYSWIGQMQPGDRLSPITGQAASEDDATWVTLNGSEWVPVGAVELAGACDGLPDVTYPPLHAPGIAPPYPPRMEVSYACPMFNALRPGELITFQNGVGRWDTPAEKDAALANMTASFSIDGLPLATYLEGTTLHTGAGAPDGYGDRALADWTATPGTHVLVAEWSGANRHVCVFTVRE